METTANGSELLNKAQAFLVSFANEKGIDLRQHFQNAEKFRMFVIAMCFRTLTENGVETREAFDMLLGDGSFKKLADSIWERCQPVA